MPLGVMPNVYLRKLLEHIRQHVWINTLALITHRYAEPIVTARSPDHNSPMQRTISDSVVQERRDYMPHLFLVKQCNGSLRKFLSDLYPSLRGKRHNLSNRSAA